MPRLLSISKILAVITGNMVNADVAAPENERHQSVNDFW